MVDTLVLYFHVHIWVSFVCVCECGRAYFLRGAIYYTCMGSCQCDVLVLVYWLHACCLQLKTQMSCLLSTKVYAQHVLTFALCVSSSC